MSLPGVFPPVEIDSLVLVDGGAMNNLPADVVRGMGADVVVAVRVGSVEETTEIDYSITGVARQTVSAMMRANTVRSMSSADLLIQAAGDFSGGDWRSAADLIEVGYEAAEAMKAQLLPYAVPEAVWNELLAKRQRQRITELPFVTRVEIRGARPGDDLLIARSLERHEGRLLDLAQLDADFALLSALDHYATIRWYLRYEESETVLVAVATPNRTAPPFLMLTLNAHNRTRDDYLFQLAGRHLAYGVLGRDSELRVDLSLGSNRGFAVELREPFGGSGAFAAGTVVAGNDRLSFVADDVIVAQYAQSFTYGQADLGWSISPDAEVRGGLRGGWYDAEVRSGNPRLPDVSGPFAEIRLRGAYDAQDAPVVPSRGLRLLGLGRLVLLTPDAPDFLPDEALDGQFAQVELHGSMVWPQGLSGDRLFAVLGLGTSFAGDPLPKDQFELGHLMRLDAFAPGEERGDHLAVGTVGYFKLLGRLPDFFGGPILAGSWAQLGSAFSSFDEADLEANLAAGLVMQTLVGPVMIHYSVGFNGDRLGVQIGRIFP